MQFGNLRKLSEPCALKSYICNESRWIMGKRTIGVAVLALTSALAMTGLHAQNSKPSTADKSFVKQAIQADMAEVKIGQLAEQKGGDQKVKQFGQTLVSDHGKNLQKAKSLAQSMDVTPPDAVNAEQRATYEKLSKLSGQRFDQEFAQHMVQDHKKDISKFEQESRKSGPVAEFAQTTLPTLKEHLQIAESLGGGHSTTGSSR